MSAGRLEKKEPNITTTSWRGLTWIYIKRPTTLETEYLGHNFPFHPLNLDDVVSVIQRPKIDEYEDHIFTVLHFPCTSPLCHITSFNELDIFAGKDFIVTIDCSGNLKTLEDFFTMCHTNEQVQRGNMSDGPGFLLYRIMDKLVDDSLPIIDKLADNVEKVENTIFAEHSRGAAREIATIRHDIITFRRIIWPMRAVVAGLEPKIRRFSKIDLTDYFGDTIDHVDKIWDALDEYKEIVEGLNDTDYSLASSRINDVLRVLTILATISTILTVVVSFYGMNIVMPGSVNTEGNPLTWVIMFLLILAIVSGMLFYFRRKRWL